MSPSDIEHQSSIPNGPNEEVKVSADEITSKFEDAHIAEGKTSEKEKAAGVWVKISDIAIIWCLHWSYDEQIAVWLDRWWK